MRRLHFAFLEDWKREGTLDFASRVEFKVQTSLLTDERDTLLSLADESRDYRAVASTVSRIAITTESQLLRDVESWNRMVGSGYIWIGVGVPVGRTGRVDARSRVFYLWQEDKPTVFRVRQRRSKAWVSVAYWNEIRDLINSEEAPESWSGKNRIWTAIDWRETEVFTVEFLNVTKERIELGLILDPSSLP